jgi:DNA-binding beta-propeller fold protein YncE
MSAPVLEATAYIQMKKLIPQGLIFLTVLCLASVCFAGKLRQVAVLDLPGAPGFESAVFANARLVITHEGADTVEIFDPVKRRLIAQVNGVLSPRGLAVDDAAGMVYIASAKAKSIVVVNSTNWRVEGMIGLRNVPENVLVVPGANELLVTNPRDHSIAVVPSGAVGQKMAERSIIDVHGKPAGIAWDAQRNVAYVALEDRSEIISINPANAGPITAAVNPGENRSASAIAAPAPIAPTAPTAPTATPTSPSAVDSTEKSSSATEVSDPSIGKHIKLAASLPTALAYEPSSQRLFVAVRYAVLAIDSESGAEQSRVAAPGGTNGLWLDAPSNTIYASSEDGSISVINVRAGGLASQAEYRGEIRGHTLAYDPAKKVMFLTGGRDGKSKLVILKEMDAVITPSANETAAKQ